MAEADLIRLRAGPADLAGAVAQAIEHATGLAAEAAPDLTPVHAAGQLLAHAAGQPRLPYHGLHHVAETVLAMGRLAAIARMLRLVSPRRAALGVIAMAAHDLDHDGSAPNNGVLEAHAAASADELIGSAGLSREDRAVVQTVILGTDPAEVVRNSERVAGTLPPGPLGTEIDLLRAMANEADVFASLLPDLGWSLAEALAEERGGQCAPPPPASFSGRLAFLRRYHCFTRPAARLALPSCQARQVAAFAEAGGSPEDGAARLDAMDRHEARRRWRAAYAGA